MTFILRTTYYNIMASHYDPLEDTSDYALVSTTFDDALEEAKAVYHNMSHYRSPGPYGSEYPKRPMLMCSLDVEGR